MIDTPHIKKIFQLLRKIGFALFIISALPVTSYLIVASIYELFNLRGIFRAIAEEFHKGSGAIILGYFSFYLTVIILLSLHRIFLNRYEWPLQLLKILSGLAINFGFLGFMIGKSQPETWGDVASLISIVLCWLGLIGIFWAIYKDGKKIARDKKLSTPPAIEILKRGSLFLFSIASLFICLIALESNYEWLFHPSRKYSDASRAAFFQNIIPYQISWALYLHFILFVIFYIFYAGYKSFNIQEMKRKTYYLLIVLSCASILVGAQMMLLERVKSCMGRFCISVVTAEAIILFWLGLVSFLILLYKKEPNERKTPA